MERLFGARKAAPEGPKLQEVIDQNDSKITDVQKKIKQIDGELFQLRQRLNGMPDNSSKSRLRQRALASLKQKRVLENRLETLMKHNMNMEQAVMTSESLQTSMSTFNALKTSVKEMKKNQKNIDMRSIEKLQDDMAESLENANEINDMFGDYNLDVDEEELDAELETLELDITEEEGVPSYLNINPTDNETTGLEDEENKVESKIPEQ